MAKSVKDLPDEIAQYIDVYEWDMRTLAGNTRFRDLQGRCLPSIALDDRLVYESIIPGQEELIAEIRRLWALKNKERST
jgi:hypothetical protein